MAKWTPEQKKTLQQQISNPEAARLTGKSLNAVEHMRRSMGIKSAVGAGRPTTVPKKTSVKEDLCQRDESFWQSQFRSQNAKYETLLKEQTVIERLVSKISELAPLSYSPLPSVVEVKESSSDTPQSALLQLSDTHIGKCTSPSQTLTFGQYNFATFMARLKFLERSVISIVKEHTNSPIEELVVAMLGDMLDGTLVHSNEAAQHDTIFSQFYAGAHVVAQFLRNIAPHFPKLRVYEVEGNHSRFQNQRRMPTKNRFSNFDKFFYALVRELVRDIPTIEWELDPQPYKVFEVQKHVIFTAHGDTVRGGDKALGVPNHGFGRLVSTFTQMANKYSMRAPNYYLTGHLHREIVLPHATGSIMVNGGFPGVDEYGLAEMFTPADPSQKLFFVHPVYGRTASYDVALKFAKVEKIAPYTVPLKFQMT